MNKSNVPVNNSVSLDKATKNVPLAVIDELPVASPPSFRAVNEMHLGIVRGQTIS